MQMSTGMFGSEFEHGTPTNEARELFGISCGQIRTRDLVHNGGWYDKEGYKLGWGDLGPVDFPRIQKALEKDQVFVILSEVDSFWKFVQGPIKIMGWMQNTNPMMNHPGRKYLTEHGMMLITSTKVFCISDYSNDYGLHISDGITFQRISRKGLQRRLRKLSTQLRIV